MANSRDSADRREHVTINTAPGADGYYTNPFTPYNKRTERKAGEMYFAIRETGELSASFVGTVSLQWRQKGASAWEEWQTYDTYTAVQRKIVDDYSAEVQWRAGIANGDFTSGQVTIGFNW